MLGVIVWCILLIFIAACILPWWFLPAVFVTGVLWTFMNKKMY